MSSAKDVTDANFKAEVLENSKPTIVDFWAEWCGPCRQLGPVLDAIAAGECAGEVVVVGSGDPVGLQRLVRASQDLGGIPSGRPLVVVNRVRASAVGADPQARIVEALGRFAGMEDLHLVPEDRETLDRLLLQGRVLAEGAPRSPAREAIRALAARVAPERFGQAETPARRRRHR